MSNQSLHAFSDAPTLFVVGAGPGIGLATARRFAREGFRVGLIARNPDHLADLARSIERDGTTVSYAAADVQRPDELTAALGRLGADLGPADVLAYTPLPDVATIKPVAETSTEDVAAALALGVTGAVAATQALLPAMVERGTGTLLFTTGSAAVQPSPDRATSAVANAAETAYVRLLHDALAPMGINAAQLVIVGAVGPGRKHEPDTVADRLWTLHDQPGDALTVLP